MAGFQKRHPDISLRIPTPLNYINVRARMLNKEVTNKYFNDLNEVLSQLKLKTEPKRIWNIDETNVSLTHKPSRVLAECSQRNVPGGWETPEMVSLFWHASTLRGRSFFPWLSLRDLQKSPLMHTTW